VSSAVRDGGGDKFPEDGSLEDSDKFSSLWLCPKKNFERGLFLEEYIGLPTRTDNVRAMMNEHIAGAPFHRKSGKFVLGCEDRNDNPDKIFPAYIVFPDSEWNFVVRNDEYTIANILDRTASIPKRVSRQPTSISQLMDEARQRCPDLTLAEVIALNLWTGPMYKLYAMYFRSICICSKEAGRQAPAPSPFVTTMHAINSGVVKLARQRAKMQQPRVLYRGCCLNSTVDLNAYLDRECAAMVEPCVLAFSEDRNVGIQYARRAKHPSQVGILLELDLAKSGIVWDADNIEWLTQFPHQYEVLFPALTQVDILSGPHSSTEEDLYGISVYKVRVVLNPNNCTLEELLAKTPA
jgi:hypothetical protein